VGWAGCRGNRGPGDPRLPQSCGSSGGRRGPRIQPHRARIPGGGRRGPRSRAPPRPHPTPAVLGRGVGDGVSLEAGFGFGGLDREVGPGEPRSRLLQISSRRPRSWGPAWRATPPGKLCQESSPEPSAAPGRAIAGGGRLNISGVLALAPRPARSPGPWGLRRTQVPRRDARAGDGGVGHPWATGGLGAFK
jgi:hypothetical protein